MDGMGRVINLYLIPGRISPDRWRAVYRESLRLVEAYDFMDGIETRRNGLRYSFARKTRDREGLPGPGSRGWLALGELRTGERTGEFMLCEDIRSYLQKGTVGSPGYVNIWGAQTKGGETHICLLAIACLIVSRLPGAAMVSGDISAEQCARAVRWANGCLEEPINLPDTCRMERLLERLRAFTLSEGELLAAFCGLTAEARDARMGEFLRREFSGEALYDYYRQRFLSYGIAQQGFARIMKEYLEMGFDFQRLCRIAVADPDGMRAEPKEFLKRVLESGLHMKEKGPSGSAELAEEWADRERPETEYDLADRMLCLLTGVGSRRVNVFYPPEKIRADCRKVFGDRCQVDALWESLMTAEREIASRRAGLWDILQRDFDDSPGQEQDAERYDIHSYRELADFRPGCRVKPELEEDLTGNFRMLHQYMEENFEEFRVLKRKERENYLIQESAGLLLREEVWERVFDRIMDDSYVERICGILSVNREKRDGELFCRSLFSSLQVIDHYWEKTES